MLLKDASPTPSNTGSARSFHREKPLNGNKGPAVLIIIIIIIIIIKKDWQCKAGRGRLTPYQSEDPSPTLPTYRAKEEKGRIVEDKKWESNWAYKKALDLLLKPASPTPSNTGSTRSFQRETDRRIKVLRYCEVLQRGGAKVYRCAIKAPRVTRTGT